MPEALTALTPFMCTCMSKQRPTTIRERAASPLPDAFLLLLAHSHVYLAWQFIASHPLIDFSRELQCWSRDIFPCACHSLSKFSNFAQAEHKLRKSASASTAGKTSVDTSGLDMELGELLLQEACIVDLSGSFSRSKVEPMLRFRPIAHHRREVSKGCNENRFFQENFATC